MNMFEYLVGGQCYKCGGKVKYPDGGMTGEPGFEEDQMMMRQPAPQEQALRSPETLDAYAEQLLGFIVQQLDKGTNENILKKMLVDSGIKLEEANELLSLAKEQFDKSGDEVAMEQQRQMAMMQQEQQMQDEEEMLMEEEDDENEEALYEDDMMQARYGGSMHARKLRRFFNGGPPDENEEWIRAMLQYEKRKGRMENGKAVSHNTWGFNQETLDALGANAPTTEDEAYELFKKHYLPKYQHLPLEERMRAADFGFNSGENYKIYELKQFLESQKDEQGNPIPINFDRSKYFIRDDAMKALYPEAKYRNNPDQRTKDIAAERERRTKALETDYGKYFQDLDKLPADKKAELLDAGRDFYYQNLDKNPDGSPNVAYGESWYGRIELYKKLKAKQAAGNTTPQEDKDIQEMQGQLKNASSSNQSMTNAANNAAPGSSITVTNDPEEIKRMQAGNNNTTANNPTYSNAPSSMSTQGSGATSIAVNSANQPINPNTGMPVQNIQTQTNRDASGAPSNVNLKGREPWSVPDWSDPYGASSYVAPTAEDADSETAKKVEFKAPTIGEQEQEGDNVVIPGNQQSTGPSDKTMDEVPENTKRDSDAVRQLTPVKTVTRRHQLEDALRGKDGNVSGFNKKLIKGASLADPNVAGLIAGLSSKGGLGSWGKMIAGAVGAASNIALGVQKFKPNETTVEYNADGQAISRKGGEWNPFVDNRRKLRITMQMYPLGGETTPYSFDEWVTRSGNIMTMGNEMQLQQQYEAYRQGFPPPPNTVSITPPPQNMVGPTGPSSSPPAANNNNQNNNQNKQKCLPGQPCADDSSGDPNKPKWWQIGKRMQPEYGNTKRGDPLGTQVAQGAVIGADVFLTGLDEVNARKEWEKQVVKNQIAGDTMDSFRVFNPQSTRGDWVANAGTGENFQTDSTGAIPDTGTTVKRGGQIKYQKGGTYNVSYEELMRIISMGGEVEFLD